MIRFELYLCDTLFKVYIPEAQCDFMYASNLTAFENKKMFSDNLQAYCDGIKLQNQDSIDAFESFRIDIIIPSGINI